MSQEESKSEPKPTFIEIGTIHSDIRDYEIINLETGTAYYVMITAENELGEGYKNQMPFLIQTTKQDFRKDRCDVYEWGNNTNSELGLSDEQIQEHKCAYVNHSMRKILKNKLFENGGLLQVAPGNVSILFLYLDKSTHQQNVIFSGVTTLARDEQSQ